MEIYNGKCTKIVHINHLQHRHIPGQQDVAESDYCDSHCLKLFPTSVDHVILPPPKQTLSNRYPQRQRRPPDWYCLEFELEVKL